MFNFKRIVFNVGITPIHVLFFLIYIPKKRSVEKDYKSRKTHHKESSRHP